MLHVFRNTVESSNSETRDNMRGDHESQVVENERHIHNRPKERTYKQKTKHHLWEEIRRLRGYCTHQGVQVMETNEVN